MYGDDAALSPPSYSSSSPASSYGSPASPYNNYDAASWGRGGRHAARGAFPEQPGGRGRYQDGGGGVGGGSFYYNNSYNRSGSYSPSSSPRGAMMMTTRPGARSSPPWLGYNTSGGGSSLLNNGAGGYSYSYRPPLPQPQQGWPPAARAAAPQSQPDDAAASWYNSAASYAPPASEASTGATLGTGGFGSNGDSSPMATADLAATNAASLPGRRFALPPPPSAPASLAGDDAATALAPPPQQQGSGGGGGGGGFYDQLGSDGGQSSPAVESSSVSPSTPSAAAAACGQDVYRYSSQEGLEIEDILTTVIDRIVGYEMQQRRAEYHTLQSIMEKVVRYNASFYANFVHPYLASTPEAWARVRRQIVSRVRWQDGDQDTRNQFMGFSSLKRIADDIVLRRILRHREARLAGAYQPTKGRYGARYY
jgi:hypothetical protein